MAEKKGYCYSLDCKLVETGFRLEKWKVCSHCHCEVTDVLAEKIADREKDKEERDKKKKDNEIDLDDSSAWEFL